jgi:alkylation response protein AidB-like acyl-CoA dehydrogenase
MSTAGFVADMEQLGLADQSVATACQAHVTIGSLPLYQFGNDEQRERWLRPLALAPMINRGAGAEGRHPR